MASLATLLAASVLAFALTAAVDAGAQRGQKPQKPATTIAEPPEASAQSTASVLKSEGDRFLAEKKFVEALDAYERSEALVPSPVLDFNRGRVLQFLGRYPEALDALLRFQSTANESLLAKVPGLHDLVGELENMVATVVLNSNVAGARVLVGGKDVGQTPLSKPLQVNSGMTTIALFSDGYFPFRKDIVLRGHAITNVDAPMASRDTFGYLVVKSGIASSLVYVDKLPIGVVPAEAALTPGTHGVRIAHDGYNDALTQVVMTPGERKELSLDPSKGTRITSRWWFWTGVSVVALGIAGAVTAVALTTERHPPSGNFSPGQVSF